MVTNIMTHNVQLADRESTEVEVQGTAILDKLCSVAITHHVHPPRAGLHICRVYIYIHAEGSIHVPILSV